MSARVALGVVLVATLLLVRLPETRAADPGSMLVPWPVAARPSDVALTGGLVLLRTRGSRMIRVPASEFTMGSTSAEILDGAGVCQREPLSSMCDERSFADELFAHRVRLSSYLLDRREVSVADYESCVRVKRCRPLPYEQGARRFQRSDFPVSLVTWDEAQVFCSFRGARLPTEAEFERAARGPSGRRFPWGDRVNDRVANHGRLGVDESDASDGFAELAPVGSFLSGQTPEGFLDLAGNVAEWVEDRYATQYPDSLETDPRGPDAASATSARVVRGGSYVSPMAWLRGAARGARLPSERRPSTGFRCARSQRAVTP